MPRISDSAAPVRLAVKCVSSSNPEMKGDTTSGAGGPIRAPTRLECFGDLGDLRRVGDEPGRNRPHVPVLRRERRLLVLAEQPHAATVSATRQNIPTAPRR